MFSPALILGRPGPKITSLGSLISGSDLSSYSLGNITVPRAGILVVFIGGARTGAGTRTVSSISIDGNSAAADIATAAANECAAIRGRVVAAGNIAVAAAFSGSMQGCGAWCWLIEGYVSATPRDSYAATPGSTSAAHQTIMDYTSGDGGVFGDYMLRGTTVTTVTVGTFDGVTLTEDTGLDYDVAGGHYEYATATEANKTIGFTSSGYNAGAACGLVYR